MAEREEDAFERKESKKDKGYVAFRSDDDSVGEEEEEDSRWVFNRRWMIYLSEYSQFFQATEKKKESFRVFSCLSVLLILLDA